MQHNILSSLFNANIKLSEEDKKKFCGNFIFQQIILQNTVQEQQAMLVKLSAEVSTLTQQNQILIRMLQTLITTGNEAQATTEASPKPGFFGNTSS